jgi:hypothetical protein
MDPGLRRGDARYYIFPLQKIRKNIKCGQNQVGKLAFGLSKAFIIAARYRVVSERKILRPFGRVFICAAPVMVGGPSMSNLDGIMLLCDFRTHPTS